MSSQRAATPDIVLLRIPRIQIKQEAGRVHRGSPIIVNEQTDEERERMKGISTRLRVMAAPGL